MGGLKRDTNKDELEAYFSKFGKVRKLDLVMDPQADNKNRGFAFVQYENVESCEMACQLQYHSIDGHSVEVKRAVLKPPGTEFYIKSACMCRIDNLNHPPTILKV